MFNAGKLDEWATNRYLITLELRTLLLSTLSPHSLRPQTRRLYRGCRSEGMTAELGCCSRPAELSCTAQNQTPTKQRLTLRRETRQKTTAHSLVCLIRPGRVRWRSGDTCFSQGPSRRVHLRHSQLCGAVATEQSLSCLYRPEGWGGRFKS